MFSLQDYLTLPTPQRALQVAWPVLQKLPMGGSLLGRVIGHFVPYTGNVSPQVVSLEAGRAVVSMDDGPEVRNHLKSIHAMALGNLAEFTSAVAVMYAISDDRRAILTHIQLDYVRKSRGRVTATAASAEPLADGLCDLIISIIDAEGQEVVKGIARWKISQNKPKQV